MRNIRTVSKERFVAIRGCAVALQSARPFCVPRRARWTAGCRTVICPTRHRGTACCSRQGALC